MAIHYGIRSVRNALLAIMLIGSLTTACKKSGLGGADVDPRNQYVGTYDGGYQAATLVNNSLESNRESGKITITITKSETANQFYLDLLFNGVTNQKLTAELVGNAFTVIDKQSETLSFDGKSYTAKYTATGQFTDKVVNTATSQITEKVITLNTVTETLQSGQTLSRRGDISGTKK